MADPPRDIKPASTIMLLRDGARGLEVFMVERHHRIDFATGALVFPGGKVDSADADRALRARCQGIDDLDDAAISVRIAGIRETFEESGVLLARPRGAGALIDAERLSGIEARHRRELDAGGTTLGTIAEREDLELACDLLVPFAHWLTPDGMPKRFDTWFFLVDAPADQIARHDGHETVDSVWTTVDDALRARQAGERSIVFPTLSNLRKLGRSPSVADAMTAARSKQIVTVLPRVGKDEDGELSLFLPAEADYDIVKTSLAALRE
jgi:8-oxo-dGTP pyrophosphatase MutT (NUDIX family)